MSPHQLTSDYDPVRLARNCDEKRRSRLICKGLSSNGGRLDFFLAVPTGMLPDEMRTLTTALSLSNTTEIEPSACPGIEITSPLMQ